MVQILKKNFVSISKSLIRNGLLLIDLEIADPTLRLFKRLDFFRIVILLLDPVIRDPCQFRNALPNQRLH